MTADPPEDGPSGPAPEVRALFPSCNKCRRERAASLRRRGAAAVSGLPGLTLQPTVTGCTHLPEVWAPGFGPGAEPPEGSGWETRPDGPV
ncbi:hypothetical protein [Frankia sp. AvcI1]|uniref:hypothetical protein n=1 Tax=Frankia sp. AvcI1 TaxID=573496 RepID=UPI0021195130|nr:hypothetical protein [Frankia sp. AvcI1]